VQNPIWDFIFNREKDHKDMVELLKSLPVFDGLSNNELVIVERMLHMRKYAAGEQVFEEGKPGIGMYIVKSGEIEIVKRIGASKNARLAVVGKGQFFGEMALLAEMPRSAGGAATCDSVLFSMCRPDLVQISERNPVLANKIITNLSRLISLRLVKANENLEKLQIQLDELKASNKKSEAAGEQ
jgi:CRP-like cAMP-binding protein